MAGAALLASEKSILSQDNVERFRSLLARFVASDILHLIIMPTERCNFRCVYCYEDFARGRMKGQTVDGLKKLLAVRAPGLRALTLDWFGGEPLLTQPIIEEVQSHVQKLVERHPGLKMQAGITTNGYLLSPQALANLVTLGVTKYQISVDGLRSTHDSRRFKANGEGTFDRIWSNLLAARESELEFRICLRVHVDRENQAELPQLLKLMGKEFGGDERFEVFVRSVGRLGGPRDCELQVLGGDEVEVVEELRQYAVQQQLSLATSEGPNICYAAAANSFVVRSTGALAKCTVALRHPNNHIGRLNPNGTSSLDNDKISGWVRGLLDGDQEALGCPMIGFADPRVEAGSK